MKIKTYNKIIEFLEKKRDKKIEKILKEIRENAHQMYQEALIRNSFRKE